MLKTKFSIPETSRLVNNISHWIKSAIVSLPLELTSRTKVVYVPNS